MADFRESRLWKESLGTPQTGAAAQWIDRLVASYEAMRRQAVPLSSEISRDLPSFTVHDISHIDALWGIADIIAGYGISLNPLEAYLFGAGLICHDLAMSSAAYPGGIADVDRHPLFAQGVAVLFPERHSAAELQTDELNRVRAWVLRENHAYQASALAVQEWKNENTGSRHYLIEDTVLRESFGHLIGRLAMSHWWSIARVAGDLSRRLGPSGGMPAGWTIDEFKIAALLRAADAAHIDQRRAPSFLFALRHVHGIAAEHWRFQSLLSAPVLRGSRLLYASVRDFIVGEAEAWWLCYDTIKMIDAELTAIDAYCDEYRRDLQFAARGVAGASDPAVLSRYVTVSGWFPIDAKPTITDVPALIKKLGGQSLYGTTSFVPLRELLQNALDAVEALKIEHPGSGKSSRIRCALRLDGDRYVLTVSDDGIGMSREVILHALLDFGASLWHSELLRREFPRLAERRFKSIGRFGIGFFSVFMWTRCVKVITRRFDARPDETLVLEFTDELRVRPVLRVATPQEMRYDGGTSVELSIDNPNFLRRERFDNTDWLPEAELPSSLARAVFAVVPFPSVPIDIEDHEYRISIGPIDWERTPTDNILSLLMSRDVKPEYQIDEADLKCRLHMRLVRENDGTISGLGGLPDAASRLNAGRSVVITPGGVFLGMIDDGLPGVFFGDPIDAARSKFRPRCSNGAIARWADEQISLLRQSVALTEEPGIATQGWSLGADVNELKIVLSAAGLLSLREIREWASKQRYVVLIQGYSPDLCDPANRFVVSEGVLVCGFTAPFRHYIDETQASGFFFDYLARLVAEAWGIPLDILESRCNQRELFMYGRYAGEEKFELDVTNYVLLRTQATKLPRKLVVSHEEYLACTFGSRKPRWKS
jgi:Histidine kinase-, DNA gyrase B-, and HSP90-like ATPase